MNAHARTPTKFASSGASASEATGKGAARVSAVQKALRDKIGDRGMVKLTQFNIAPLNPNQPGAT